MKEMTIMENIRKRMSSLEIAELTGKKHKEVMRDIRKLIDQGAIGERNFALTSYLTDQNKREPMYLLDFDATMTLMTGYDAKRRSIVVKRWRELETGVAQPAYQIPPRQTIITDERTYQDRDHQYWRWQCPDG